MVTASPLRTLTEGVHVVERGQRFFGAEIGTRMTVLESPTGLLLHSPVALDTELREAVESAGPVAWIVAPNRFHHLFAGEWKNAFPNAGLLGAPGLAEKRSDLRFDGELPDDAPAEWAGVFDVACFRAMPLSNEVVLLHRPSRTVVVTDLVISLGTGGPGEIRGRSRTGLRIAGLRGEVGTTLLERLATRDKRAASAFLDEVLAWDFERIVLAHGTIVEKDARETLRRAWSWLPGVRPA